MLLEEGMIEGSNRTTVVERKLFTGKRIREAKSEIKLTTKNLVPYIVFVFFRYFLFIFF